jgi:hypothetical protein
MKYILWGSKLCAEQVIYNFRWKYNLRFDDVVDNYAVGEFHGNQIVKPSGQNLADGFIIVACEKCDTYLTIKKELLGRGLKEFNEKYAIYPNKPIQYCQKGEELDNNVLKHVDIYIHQIIKSDNEYGGYKLSDEYIIPLLENCEKKMGYKDM